MIGNVALLEPELPAVTESQAALVVAVQETFAATAMERPLHAALEKLVLEGEMARAAAVPACTTVQVRVMPPPATTTPPVRAEVPLLVATLKVTVPLPEPELPPVTASHATLVVVVHATFAVTAMDRPLQAALEKLVLAGAMARDAAVPACTTVQVRVMPPPATTTPPVRAVVPLLVATLKVTVPLPEPELPPVILTSFSPMLNRYLFTRVHRTCREADANA